MPVLGYEPEMTWRCDGCQRLFQVVYDDQTEEERDLPDLLTSDERTFCERCRESGSALALTSPSIPGGEQRVFADNGLVRGRVQAAVPQARPFPAW